MSLFFFEHCSVCTLYFVIIKTKRKKKKKDKLYPTWNVQGEELEDAMD